MSANTDLIASLETLAAAIERNPPPIIGSDIRVHTKSGSAIGQSISVGVGPGFSGSAVGQRIVVVSDRPGQTVIGQRVRVSAGGSFSPDDEPQLPSSSAEISAVIEQLRSAAETLKSSPSSRSWITGLLGQVSKWGQSALSGAVSAATGALVKAQLGA